MTTQTIAVNTGIETREARSWLAERFAGPIEILKTPGFAPLGLGNALAQSFSTRMQGIVVAWMVLELTGSSVWLAVVNGLPALAVVLFSLMGGVIADSKDGRRALIGIRSLLTGSAFLALVLAMSGEIRVEHLVLYVLLAVGLASMDAPVGRTLALRTVGAEWLMHANAMQTFGMNIVGIVAPAGIAVLVGTAGAGAGFAVLAVGYAIGALLAVRSRQVEPSATQGTANPMAELKAGLAYVRSAPKVASLVSLGFLMPLAGTYFALVPVFSRDVLGAGAAGMGLLVAVFSLGALLSSVTLIGIGRLRARGHIVLVLSILFGAGMVAFALSQSLLLSCVISFGMGLVGSSWQNILSTMVQTESEPAMRGRALSLFTMGFQLASLGWLIGGLGSSAIGPELTVVIAGIGFGGLASLVFALNHKACSID